MSSANKIENNDSSSQGAASVKLSEVETYEAELKTHIKLDETEWNQKIPEIATLLLKVIEKVKDIYQVYPALVLISDLLTSQGHSKKLTALFRQRPDLPN